MKAVPVIALVLALALPATAQDVPRSPASQQETSTPQIDPTKLGVSLARIERGLRVAEDRDKATRDGLRLEFNIQVFGVAPRIDVIPDGEDLVFGPVPGTAPSHPQFLEYVTPQIYRLPVAPLSTFAVWAAKWAADRSKKARCEEEIANYRALIMQGVNVAAPRCTQ